MFGTIRKHSKWLWLVIVTLMVISLVYWTGNRSDLSTRPWGAGEYGTIAGKEVRADDYAAAIKEVYLNYYLSSGEWPDGPEATRAGFDAMRETYFRLFLIQKQQELGIHVGQDVVTEQARNIVRNFARDGADGLTVFKRTVLDARKMTLGDFERFLRHTLGMQQLAAAVATGARLVTPQEAREVYEREHRELSAQVVFFTASNFLARVTADPAAVAAFYTNQQARYRLPERVQVNYLRFPMTNYWAAAEKEITGMTNLPLLLDAEYQRRGGTNFYTDLTPEQARASIREELHKELALREARKDAARFTDELLNREPVKPENLATLAAQKGFTVEVSPAFDRSTPPTGLAVNDQFLRAAFSLRADEPFYGPVPGEDAMYVIGQHKQLPSEVPPFEAVRERVEQDHRFFEAVRLARAEAQTFAATVTNGLAAGKTFAELATAAGVAPTLLPPFSLNTRALPEVENHMSLQQFKQIAFTTGPGQASPSIPTMDGGMLVYVQSVLPFDEQKAERELPDFLKLLQQARQSEAFQAWFGQEAQLALANTPINRPRQPEVGTTPLN